MNLLLVVFAAILLILTITSGWIKERMWGSETLVCLVAGFAIGPWGFGILALDPVQSPFDREILTHVTRLTLALSVMSAALSLPTDFLGRNRHALLLVLGPGTLVMCAAASFTAWAILGIPLALAFLIGAVVTPTDPVLARSIVSGRLAQRCVPDRLRRMITAESGINDGLALPLVMLALLVLERTGRPFEASAMYLLWEVAGALALGWLLGKATGMLFRFTHERDLAEEKSLTATTLALALVVLASVGLLGADGILAVFVAGVVFKRAMKAEHEEAQQHFQDAVDRSFTLPVFVLLGAGAPIAGWLAGGWPMVGAAAAIVLLRRLPAWLVLQALGRPYAGRSEARFAGWFGPIGVAALFYAALSLEHLPSALVWHVVSLCVCLSVVLFGVTGTPFTRRMGASRTAPTEEG